MPLDPSIILGGRPAPIANPLETLSTFAQLQQVREQTEDRRAALELRRQAAEEAREAARERAQIAQAYKESVTIDPKTGQPKVDFVTFAARAPASAIPKMLDEVRTYQGKELDLQTKRLAFGALQRKYLGDLGQSATAAKGDPAVWKDLIQQAHTHGALTDQQAAEFGQLQDPQQILARAQGWLQGGESGEGFTLGEGQIRYGPTGQEIARGPAKAPPPSAGFTLAPGAVRYGPTGEIIAQSPAPPATGGFTLTPGATRFGPGGEVIAAVPPTPGAMPAISPQAMAQSALALVDRLEKHPGIGAATGAYEWRGFTQNAVDFNAIRDQLVAALALPNLGALKGAMSEKDLLFVQNLATRLGNRKLSEAETRTAIGEARTFLESKARTAATTPPVPDLTGLSKGRGRRFTTGPFAGQTWALDDQGQPYQVQ